MNDDNTTVSRGALQPNPQYDYIELLEQIAAATRTTTPTSDHKTDQIDQRARGVLTQLSDLSEVRRRRVLRRALQTDHSTRP